MDLPIILQNMISTVMNTCGTVSSWNIFENNQNLVNVNIRFDKNIGCANMGSHTSPVMPVSYKKQSINTA